MIRRFSAFLASLSFAAVVLATPVSIAIDWNRPIGEARRDAYSLNAFQSFNPDIPAAPGYREGIAYINPGMMRYHASSITSDSRTNPKGWLDHGTRSWDVERIRQATAAWPRHAEVQITIHSWPSWMYDGEERLLAEKHYDDYAALCAELVRIVNIELGLGVVRWEPMNERELAYVRALERNGKKARYDQLIEIYNRCARAMKRTDPKILVGGPAISSASWRHLIRPFLRGARDNIDFFSCHLYVTDDPTRPDDSVFDSAMNFGSVVGRVVEMVKEEIPGRKVDVVLNEFNISWNWRAKDARMLNHKGAVFDALVMSSVLSQGGASTFAWNDSDNIYGKMSRSFELRPSAHVYHHLNGHFVGSIVRTETSDDRAVIPYAVVQKEGGRRALMLINRSDDAQAVRLQATGQDWAAGTVLERGEISEAGHTVTQLRRDRMNTEPLNLPPYSVTFLFESAP